MEALRVSEARRPAPGFNLHIVHLADADLLPELKRAKIEGLPLSVETCPHYLNFAAEDVLMGDTRWMGQGGKRRDGNANGCCLAAPLHSIHFSRG
jgi:hypothetical protein